jgi:hypothetical protein
MEESVQISEIEFNDQKLLNNEDSLLIIKELYENQQKVKYFIYQNNSTIAIIKIDMKNKNALISEELIFNNYNIKSELCAFCIYLNRVYCIAKNSYAFMIDLNLKQVFQIELPEEENLINKLSAYCFHDTKLFFSGGLTNDNKISNLLSSFDISTYKYDNEKVRDNNMIGRFKHGSIALFGFIYIIGGFTDFKETEICNIIQVAKFDNLINNWFNLKVEGMQPALLINPLCLFVKNENLVIFSDYKYCKIWYMSIKSNTGVEVDLAQKINFGLNYNLISFTYNEDKEFFTLIHIENTPSKNNKMISTEINLKL